MIQIMQTPDQSSEAKPENLELLKRQLEHFAKSYKNASNKKERQEKLMRRKIASTWSPEKTARMVRRLSSTNNEIEQASAAMDSLSHRLSELGIEVSVVSAADVAPEQQKPAAPVRTKAKAAGLSVVRGNVEKAST